MIIPKKKKISSIDLLFRNFQIAQTLSQWRLKSQILFRNASIIMLKNQAKYRSHDYLLSFSLSEGERDSPFSSFTKKNSTLVSSVDFSDTEIQRKKRKREREKTWLNSTEKKSLRCGTPMLEYWVRVPPFSCLWSGYQICSSNIL